MPLGLLPSTYVCWNWCAAAWYGVAWFGGDVICPGKTGGEKNPELWLGSVVLSSLATPADSDLMTLGLSVDARVLVEESTLIPELQELCVVLAASMRRAIARSAASVRVLELPDVLFLCCLEDGVGMLAPLLSEITMFWSVKYTAVWNHSVVICKVHC